MSRLIAVALLLCLLAGMRVANAEPVLGRDSVAVSYSAKRHHADTIPCRHHLDCGCSLAKHLHISDREKARRLWVARNWLHEFSRVSGPMPGAIAVLSRKGGGHVGIVRGVDANGNPIVESFKYYGSVGTATYPKRRVLGYVAVNGMASR
jgi:hypothetical protein